MGACSGRLLPADLVGRAVQACGVLCVLSIAADAGLASQRWLRCLAAALLLLVAAAHWPDGGADGSGAKAGLPSPARELPRAAARGEAEPSGGAAEAAPAAAGEEAAQGWGLFACCGAGVREADREDVPAAHLGPGPLRLAAGANGQHPKFCGLRLEDRADGPAPRPAPVPCQSPQGARLVGRAAGVSGAGAGRLPRAAPPALGRGGPQGPRHDAAVSAGAQGRSGGARLRMSMEWRERTLLESGFRDGTIDDSLHQQFSSYWPPTGLMGCDREGDAIYWNRAGASDIGSLLEVPMEFLYRHEVFTLTRIVQALEELSQRQGRPALYMTVVVDCSGLSFKHLSPAAALKYKQIVRLAEDYFPEMVKRVLIVRAPWFFNQGWSVVSRFFDEGTRNKFSVVKTAETCQALAKVMDPRWIPQELGGTCRLGAHRFCAPVIPEGGEAPRELLQAICAEFPAP
ncbi:unnamed protein product [Prorocentrum cordatum]|uniref:CRAL-TRIO domain-containing protein n=1 Tax=Prorocentrum cordatum TaxID=2364126 RepID=A0ABN9VEZ3_9DINO|nr:unnamed protein product [Polarella glacialis]